MVEQVCKRNGEIVPFDSGKIKIVLQKAFDSINEVAPDLDALVSLVVKEIDSKHKEGIPSVEDISDFVENILMKKHPAVAKSFIIYREYKRQLREVRRAYVGSTEKSNLSINAIRVLEARYLLKDNSGNIIETPNQMFERVAEHVVRSEKKYLFGKKYNEMKTAFYDMMFDLDFLPNSPTLMNAGTDLGMLSACFVIPVADSISEIFDAVKYCSIIHQSGGGCIISGSQVFTTFCGLENIEVLYDKLLTEVGVENSEEKGVKTIDLDNKHIFTLAFDKSIGEFKKGKVNKIWRFDNIKTANKIITVSGVELTTSTWHPFFILNNNGDIVEKKAEELERNDILIKSDSETKWLFEEYKMIDNILIDEDFAWLVGFAIGDGSLGNTKQGLRFRLFDGVPECLEHAKKIFENKLGLSLTIQKDKRGLYSLTTYNRVLTNLISNNVFVAGEKNNLQIPSFIFKSPKSVVASFLSGLIDSDGYIDNRNARVSFSTVCKKLSEQLISLLSLLGLRPYFRTRQPKGRAKKECYEVTFSVSEDILQIKQLLLSNLKCDFKKDRLFVAKPNKLKTLERLPIKFSVLEQLLKDVGVKTSTTEIHKQAISINNKKFWLARAKWGNGINRTKLLDLLEAIGTKKALKLKVLVPKLDVVKSVEQIKTDLPFYDFSVENYQNYLSGKNGLAVIHNTGMSFSRLRPRGSLVKSTKGVASGPISFMRAFDAATETIKQGGKRRGANMGVLRVDHPDILEFISCKQTEGQLANFNISVAMTDVFMNAVEQNQDYDLNDPRTGLAVSRLNARSVFDLIANMAWQNGEPGVIFIDEINRKHQVSNMGVIESTNPCGEQPLLPFESCNLGSINLANFVESDGSINWKRLKNTIELAVRFLDDVIDMNKYPLTQIENMTKSSRKIGLGVMGWADMLLQLKIPYNSDEAIYLAEKVMKFITDTSVEYSSYLGELKGDFPAFKGSFWYQQGFKHMRNSTTTTIAPTGTIGMISDASSGVEPHFSLAYTRLTLDNQEFVYTNKYLDQELKKTGLHSEELMIKISKTGMVNNLEGITEDIKKIYVTSREIDSEWHIKMQAAFQKYTHNAVSKTINMPNFVTIEDVKKAYKMAYDLKCKGVTIYRDASREIQILNAGCATKTEETKKPLLQKLITPDIPKDECPICHNKMTAQEGCYTCPKCSYSKCS